MSLRTKKTEQAYVAARADGKLVPLHSEPKVPNAPEFYYWKIVANRFPHDRHHTLNLLIVLKHDCAVSQVSLEELEELWYTIVPWADEHYDYVKLNLKKMRSIEGTPHLQIYNLKPEYR